MAKSETYKEITENAMKCHAIWYKFSKFLTNAYGKDLWSGYKYLDKNNKKFKYRNFDSTEFNKRLVGYDVMQRVERYINRFCPEIKIIRCDDAVYAGSIILLIPHPEHGITVMYIPQCTSQQNQFFLYGSHCKALIKGLTEMKKVYSKGEY